jgi:rare lipoprotein A
MQLNRILAQIPGATLAGSAGQVIGYRAAGPCVAALPWPPVLCRAPALVLAALLTGCVGTAPSQTSAPASGSRYELANDSPLLEPIDLASIPAVVPRVENRTLAGNKSPYTVNGRTYRVMANEAGYAESGMASWYGRKFHGHLTSNGEVYDMFKVSAAHTTLPIPSYVRVTNVDNGKSIIARVNDRGPFHAGRIVDLSYAGAALLGYADRGTARVMVEAVLPGNAIAPQALVRPVVAAVSSAEPVGAERALIEAGRGEEYLQVGAFASIDSARSLVTRLTGMTGLPVLIHSDTGDSGTVLHKVRMGPLSDTTQVQDLIARVQAARLGTPFRVRIQAQ